VAAVRTVAVAVLAVALGGCGNTSSPPESQARGSLDTFLALCAAKRPLRTLPALQRPAQAIVLRARDPAEGCGRVLDLPGASTLRAGDFRGARVTLRDYDGATTRFDVVVAGMRRLVTVTFGEGGWRLEGPAA
jgi:hypothetical protein